MAIPMNVQRYRVLEGVETPEPDASVDLAKNWATKTDGEVADSEYSSKAYAQSTDANAPVGGSAKQWSIKTDGPVAGGELSAKAHAILAAASAASAAGAVIAKQALVNGQEEPADVTALAFGGGLIAGFFCYSVRRVTSGEGATAVFETGLYMVLRLLDDYALAPLGALGVTSVEFTITAGGQVQYTSTEITGDPEVSEITTMHWALPEML